jgi:hypothetical protein
VCPTGGVAEGVEAKYEAIRRLSRSKERIPTELELTLYRY